MSFDCRAKEWYSILLWLVAKLVSREMRDVRCVCNDFVLIWLGVSVKGRMLSLNLGIVQHTLPSKSNKKHRPL